MVPMPKIAEIPAQMTSPAPETTDNELAVRWQNGEPEAYTELVQRHLDSVHRYVRIRCGNDADTADVCQEVFLEVCLKIGNFNPDFAFTAWLYTIARCKTADHFRRRRPAEEFDPAHHGGTDTASPSESIERRENAREAWERVFRLLPENHANALWMRVQGRMSVAQIATMLETTETNVKVMLFRARQKLAREWHGAETQPFIFS